MVTSGPGLTTRERPIRRGSNEPPTSAGPAAASVRGRWPLVGRHALLRRVRTRVAAGGSVLLLGRPGSGRTRVLDELARRHHGQVVRQGPSGGPAEELTAGRRDRPGPALVLADDLDGADEDVREAVLLASTAPWCVTVATARSGGAVELTRADPWRGGRWSVHRVPPLGAVTTGEMLRRHLDGPVEPTIVTEVFHAGGGYPKATVALVEHAVEAGCLIADDDGWRRVAPLPTHRLAQVASEISASLGPDAVRDAQLLAFGSPLPVRIATQVMSSAGWRELEGRGLVVLRAGRGSHVELTQPLHGEILRVTVDAARREEVVRTLADAYDRSGESEGSLLRVARWRLECGGWPPERWEHVARVARMQGRQQLAEDAARRALTAGGTIDAQLSLSEALVDRGAAAAAEPLLDAARSEADDEGLRTLLAVVEASCRALGRGEWDEARRGLARRRATDGTVGGARVEAHAAALEALRGDPARAATLAAAAVEHAPHDPPVQRSAAVATAFASVDRLEPASVPAEIADALEGAGGGAEAHGLPLVPALLRGVAMLSDDGDPLGPLRAARTELDRAIAEGRTDAVWWSTVVGWLQLRRGDVRKAAAAFSEARMGAEVADPLRLRPVVQAELALVAALRGVPSEAGRRLRALGRDRDEALRVAGRVDLVEAWLEAAALGPVAGAVAAVDAGDRAGDAGRRRAAVEAWHLAVRLGHPEQVGERLRAARAEHEHPIVALVATHADALAAGEATELRELACSFAEVGRYLLAAEAAAQAAALGEPRSAALAGGLVAVCPGARTPAVDEIEPVTLTPRQRQVAGLLLAGARPRAIADRTSLSVRTVENHLSQAYRRLGVSGREELVRVHRFDALPPTA